MKNREFNPFGLLIIIGFLLLLGGAILMSFGIMWGVIPIAILIICSILWLIFVVIFPEKD